MKTTKKATKKAAAPKKAAKKTTATKKKASAVQKMRATAAMRKILLQRRKEHRAEFFKMWNGTGVMLNQLSLGFQRRMPCLCSYSKLFCDMQKFPELITVDNAVQVRDWLGGHDDVSPLEKLPLMIFHMICNARIALQIVSNDAERNKVYRRVELAMVRTSIVQADLLIGVMDQLNELTIAGEAEAAQAIEKAVKTTPPRDITKLN